jgi:hypothetical protein
VAQQAAVLWTAVVAGVAWLNGAAGRRSPVQQVGPVAIAENVELSARTV